MRMLLVTAALPLTMAALWAQTDKPSMETFEYPSTVDGTKPLKADVCFKADGMKKPLLVVMHGYSGSRKAVNRDIQDLAARGVFAIAPDMRGSGDSGGKWDSGGLDVHDIVDAVREAIRRYPKQIDADNLNIVGYSGGGGNAIFCAVRFPDMFRTAVSFFGISDYGGWHASKGRPDCNRLMEAALDGPPEKQPEKYAARNAIPAAGNAVGMSKLHFVWDEGEKQCPPGMVQDFIAAYRNAGGRSVVSHISRSTDSLRWIHGYRTGNPAIRAADDLFLPDVLKPTGPPPTLPAEGRLVVCGYLVTKSFQVWLGDGTAGRATIDYEIQDGKAVVKVVDNPGKHAVRIVNGTVAPK